MIPKLVKNTNNTDFQKNYNACFDLTELNKNFNYIIC